MGRYNGVGSKVARKRMPIILFSRPLAAILQSPRTPIIDVADADPCRAYLVHAWKDRFSSEAGVCANGNESDGCISSFPFCAGGAGQLNLPLTGQK